MSVLTGWLPYRVMCNEKLIASFPTESMAAAFVRERAARWPSNQYAVVA